VEELKPASNGVDVLKRNHFEDEEPDSNLSASKSVKKTTSISYNC
jgi:hypothetical protein